MVTILVRYLDVQVEDPSLGAILARPCVAILGSPEDLAIRPTQLLRGAGWEHLPLGEIVGAGAAWSWTVAEAHFPGVLQTLDDSHLSEHLCGFTHPSVPQ